jgi:hypothetical protein
MKYILVLFSIFLLIISEAKAKSFDFRNTSWGMSVSQVIKSEKSQYKERKKEQGKETIIYASSYCNNPSKIYYTFTKNKLSFAASYISQDSKLQDKKVFLNILSCLKSQYGNTTKENHNSLVSIVEYFWKTRKETISLYMVKNGKDKYNVIVTFIPNKN